MPHTRKEQGVDRQERLAHLIAKGTGQPFSPIHASQPCSGGCIHHAHTLTLADGRRYFVKSNRNAGNMFSQEALGLAALATAQALRVPQVVNQGALTDNEACLILEAIEQGPRREHFFEDFGHRLASLHRHSTGPQFGWDHDNYIGSNPQSNKQCKDWVTFFAEYRMRVQLKLVRNNGHGTRELFRLGERVCDRMDILLGTRLETPSLLHGDLWSGNFLSDATGSAVIFDPAVYLGHREAELAPPLLFGGFSQEFFAAYAESWPLDDGWQDRVELYKLYHLLNHLNLFGSGYLENCLDILRRFA